MDYDMRQLDNGQNSITNMMLKIADQKRRVFDFNGPTSQLVIRSTAAESDRPGTTLLISEGQGGEPTRAFRTNSLALDQIVQKTIIQRPGEKESGPLFDVRSARRARDCFPEQFDSLINKAFEETNTERLIRTHVDPDSDNRGTARAFLTGNYRCFDHYEMVQAASKPLIESDANWQIISWAITDRKFHARFMSRTIQGEAAVGDLMALGLHMSNSETGCGSVLVCPSTYTLACENGMETERKFRKNHVQAAAGSDVWSMLTDEGKEINNRAMAKTVEDLTAKVSTREYFDSVIEKMKEASQDKLAGDNKREAVKTLGQILKIPQKNNDSLFESLLQTTMQPGYQNQPINRATMVNAVTALAHKAEPDAVEDWQQLGGDVLKMSDAHWSAINTASLLEAA